MKKIITILLLISVLVIGCTQPTTDKPTKKSGYAADKTADEPETAASDDVNDETIDSLEADIADIDSLEEDLDLSELDSLEEDLDNLI